MRHTKLLRIMILLVLAAALLASCGRSRTSALPKAGQSPAVQAPEETPPADQDTMPEEFEPDEEEAPFLASYIGKTGGDVVRDFGDEYETGYYEGSTFITYPDDFSFLFGTAVDEVTDDLIIRQMMAAGQWPVVYDLTGSMTYSEIVDAVGGERRMCRRRSAGTAKFIKSDGLPEYRHDPQRGPCPDGRYRGRTGRRNEGRGLDRQQLLERRRDLLWQRNAGFR